MDFQHLTATCLLHFTLDSLHDPTLTQVEVSFYVLSKEHNSGILM